MVSTVAFTSAVFSAAGFAAVFAAVLAVVVFFAAIFVLLKCLQILTSQRIHCFIFNFKKNPANLIIFGYSVLFADSAMSIFVNL